MHRRVLSGVLASSALLLTTAGTALGAHCLNESKPDGAGNHTILLIDPVTEAPTIIGGFNGGFADVYLDVDDSNTLTQEDILLVNDTFLIANHSPNLNPAQGAPAVLPNILNGLNPAGEGTGVGHAEE
jgi:hypothetical protein